MLQLINEKTTPRLMILRCAFVAWVLVWSLLSIGQQPYFKKISSSNGLPSEAVYSILEDSNGYVWIACNEGLFRYDGKQFKPYRAKYQQSFSGSSLMEDAYGRIWYQSFDGQCFYVENDTLRTLTGYKRGVYIKQFSTDEHLFVYEKNAFAVFDLKTLQRVTQFELGAFKDLPATTGWKNNFYYVKEGYLYRLYNNQGPISEQLCKVPETYLTQYAIAGFEDGVYIQTYGEQHPEVWEYSLSKRALTKRLTITNKLVVQNMQVSGERLWIQTTRGVYSALQSDFTDIQSFFPDRNFSDQLLDRKGNYWFTSPIDGIIMVPEFGKQLFEIDNYDGLRFVFSNDNMLLMSTQKDELISLDLKNGEISALYKGLNNVEIYYLYKDESEGHVIFVASDGRTYFAQHGDFKNCVSVNQAIKQVVKLEKNLYAYASSSSFGFIAIDGFNASSKWLRQTQDITQVKAGGVTLISQVPNVRCRALQYDVVNEDIYFSTLNRTFLYSRDREVPLMEIQDTTAVFNRLFQVENRIFGITVQAKIYEIKAGSASIDVTSEFGNDIGDIQQAKISNEGLLALSTKSAILVYSHYSNGKFHLQNTFHFANSTCLDFGLSNGSLWMLSNEGVIRWSLSDKRNTLSNGKLIVESTLLNDAYLRANERMEFSHDYNNFMLHFSLIDFGVPTIEKVQYKINESAWEDIPKDVRTLNLPALSAGVYTISIRAVYLNGQTESQSFSFTIRKPFWTTIWFYGLIVLVGLSLVAVIFKYQLRQMKLRNRLINEKVNLESDLNKSLLASIKSQMNPHFIFNALNTIQAFIYMNDKKNATGYLTKFSRLTRHILDFSEKEKISLSDEIKALQLYLDLEKMRFHSDFEYHILHDDVDVATILIPSMLVQPYVENAIKHGLLHVEGNKELYIRFKTDNQFLMIEIEDNGIGRKLSYELKAKRSEQHESFSLRANEQRLRLLNNNAHIGVEILDKYSDTNEPSGTLVTLRVRLYK
jgi:two-component sensor histidine kinase